MARPVAVVPDARVLVSTDAPDAVRGLLTGSSDYEEQVVWRAADTGEELARSAVLPSRSFHSPLGHIIKWSSPFQLFGSPGWKLL